MIAVVFCTVKDGRLSTKPGARLVCVTEERYEVLRSVSPPAEVAKLEGRDPVRRTRRVGLWVFVLCGLIIGLLILEIVRWLGL